MSDMTVANTILAQLGGARFVAMTGARNLLASANTLRFSLPRGFAKNGAALVQVILETSDTYTLRFLRRGGDVIREVEDVYADALRRTFTAQTGLDCTL